MDAQLLVFVGLQGGAEGGGRGEGRRAVRECAVQRRAWLEVGSRTVNFLVSEAVSVLVSAAPPAGAPKCWFTKLSCWATLIWWFAGLRCAALRTLSTAPPINLWLANATTAPERAA